MANPFCTPVVKALPFSGLKSIFCRTHFQRSFQGSEVEFYFQDGGIPAAFDLMRRVQENTTRPCLRLQAKTWGITAKHT